MEELKRLWCRLFGHDWKEIEHSETDPLFECSRCGEIG